MPNATSTAAKASDGDCHSGSESGLSTRLQRRDEWLARIAPEHHFNRLFDLIPGVHFFAKNRRGETMFSSRSILSLYGMHDEQEIVGKTDFDLNPAHMAEVYVQGDEEVYSRGTPILDKVELWFDEHGLPDWFLVNKVPILTRDGEIIGIMGLLRPFTGAAAQPGTHREIAPAVQLIRERYQARVDLADLARAVGVSPRQLQRKFRAILGLSPQELLIKTRVLAASRALRQSESSIAEISAECGFYDQSSFTEHFRRYMGQTPLSFRKTPLKSRP